MTSQPRILAPLSSGARFLTFALTGDGRPALARLARHDVDVVVGLGPALAPVEGMRPFPSSPLFPSTQGALWAACCHADRGAQLDAAVALSHALGDAFALVEEVDAFVYRGGRDLSGFEDGTENPNGDDAAAAAVGADGAGFVAVQRWVHDPAALARMSTAEKCAAVGRDLESNEELADAPASAHVKRTAQESFTPPAFMLRRSLPYGGVRERGLYFVAYVENLDRFERPLRRMSGADDGVVDGILAFTRAVTGGYYWCPPLVDGRLDLTRLGL